MSIYIYGLIAGLFTWGMTAAGAALVYLFKGFNQKVMDSMLGFAAGVMIAASFFSLIIPALDYASAFNPNVEPIVPVALGFLSGGLFLMLLDKIIPHLHLFEEEAEGPQSDIRRSLLLVLAITMHNIPEGLAVGVAFGAAAATQNPELIFSAFALAIGIGIQNFPEGTAVSMPLYREGYSKHKAFFYGQLSAIVEPIGILLGIALINFVQVILPFALAFAAGAMIFVVIEELIPESQKNKNSDLATLFTIIGLAVMMVLDVVLG